MSKGFRQRLPAQSSGILPEGSEVRWDWCWFLQDGYEYSDMNFLVLPEKPCIAVPMQSMDVSVAMTIQILRTV